MKTKNLLTILSTSALAIILILTGIQCVTILLPKQPTPHAWLCGIWVASIVFCYIWVTCKLMSSSDHNGKLSPAQAHKRVIGARNMCIIERGKIIHELVSPEEMRVAANQAKLMRKFSHTPNDSEPIINDTITFEHGTALCDEDRLRNIFRQNSKPL